MACSSGIFCRGGLREEADHVMRTAELLTCKYPDAIACNKLNQFGYSTWLKEEGKHLLELD